MNKCWHHFTDSGRIFNFGQPVEILVVVKDLAAVMLRSCADEDVGVGDGFALA